MIRPSSQAPQASPHPRHRLPPDFDGVQVIHHDPRPHGEAREGAFLLEAVRWRCGEAWDPGTMGMPWDQGIEYGWT